MSFFQALLTGRSHSVIWTLGDSNSRGNSDLAGSTPVSGTVKQWDAGNARLINVGNNDLIEVIAAGAVGSQWPQAGTTYYTLTGKIPVFVNTGIGGSAANNPTAGFSWYTNDNLFSNALTKVNNCLAYMGKSAPDLVWIELGINDVVQGNAMLQVHWTSLIDRILAQFPSVRICISQPFSSSVTTYANQTRLYQVRKWIKALCFTYSTVEIAGDSAVYTNWTGLFQVDQIHRTFFGNAFWGDKTMWGICQATTLNKWTRSMVGVFYNRISSTRIGWLDTFITTLNTAGELQNIDSFEICSNAGYTDGTNFWKNAIQDLGFISSNGNPNGGSAIIDHEGFKPAGLADIDRLQHTPFTLLCDKALAATDFIYGVFLGSNAVAATVTAAQQGSRESAAGAIVLIRQTGVSTIGIFAGSATALTDGTETRPANAFYGAVRDGGNQRLVREDVVVTSAAAAATAFSPGATPRLIHSANYNSDGSIQTRWAGVYKARVLAKYTTMNKTTFINACNGFFSDWLTNVP